jgi:cyclic pyranopterin phosphate synthase
MKNFTHIDEQGCAKMVDVSTKAAQKRMARAKGNIFLAPPTIALIKDKLIKKGDVLTVAQIAGIMAAKKTHELIPLCHPLLLENISVDFVIGVQSITARSQVICIGRTGVEMEALTAVTVALLSIYDMCKAVDKNMSIGDVVLLEKVKE